MAIALKYRVILWDFDGTLADTKGDVWTSLRYAAAKFDGTLPDDYSNDPTNLADPLEVIFKNVHPYPGDARLSEFEEHVAIHYRRLNGHEQTALYPGIHRLLTVLEESGRINEIVTLKPKEALERLLTMNGWDRLFAGWCTPDSVPGTELTKTEMIARTIRKHGLPPEQCVYIGDTWSDGIAALNIGIDFIAVTYGDGDVDSLLRQKPLHHVDSGEELFCLFTEGERHAQ